MKVLFLVDSLGNGGAERQMTLLAAGLPAEWERRVCALGGGPFVTYLRERGIAVRVLKRRSRFDPGPAATLWREIALSRPDVVHSWSWISTLIAGPVCRLCRIPLIDGTIRTGALQSAHLPLKRVGMACATTVVANSHAGLQAWGVPPRKGCVVANGFDRSRLAACSTAGTSAEHSSADAPKPCTVVMVGRMAPEKNYRLVIAAARLLRRQHPYRFLFVGDGPTRPALMAEAADLLADGTVVFATAGLEAIPQMYQADIGVLMTDPAWAQEGCSNAIMEYMACGLPVICGEGGGNRELVEDGETGFVVPPTDATALAERIAYLCAHGAERRAMGTAGWRRIADVYSLERMVEGFVRVYEEATSA